jgi:hypothetical protein
MKPVVLASASVLVAGCSVNFDGINPYSPGTDLLVPEASRSAEQRDPKRTRACLVQGALFAAGPGTKVGEQGDTNADSLMDAGGCAVLYALSRTDLPPGEQAALLARSERNVLVSQPDPRMALDGARMLADRLRVVLRETGDLRGSMEAAARATWYESRASNPEVVAVSRSVHKAAREETHASNAELQARVDAENQKRLEIAAQASGAMADRLRQSASAASKRDPKAAEAMRALAKTADQVKDLARAAADSAGESSADATNFRETMGEFAGLRAFGPFVTGDSSDNARKLLAALRKRLQDSPPDASSATQALATRLSESSDLKVSIDALAQLLGLDPVYGAVATATPAPPSAPPAAAKSKRPR